MNRLKIISLIFLILLSVGTAAADVHVAYARAGGGGAGSAGGGTGGGGVSDQGENTGGGTPPSGPGRFMNAGSVPASQGSPIDFLIFLLFFGVSLFGGKGAFKGLFFYRIKNPTRRDITFWKDKSLRNRITACYAAIQKAWSRQDPDAAKSYMSEAMLEEHRRLIDEMIERNERNVVALVDVVAIRAVYVSAGKDDLRVVITGKMIDYRINTATKKLLAGSRFRRDTATEGWRFIRRDGVWVADRINGEII
ncbi:TIM44-like domain-containing protein [Sporolactobacillus sp. CQH2019]|uniref:TIM44-like domain-containing protein n=1 Tax=Sporolactobacillus sp. CQH2019 TaxID=3023512 RepID=UPI002368C100|nr:TIM44-like domain-containing protein [Sporolactobacillus sp. CQH2019]MDD9149123.1 TIM44-like domain-containing protein [Sporolactobacillus sp. CQH2019]